VEPTIAAPSANARSASWTTEQSAIATRPCERIDVFKPGGDAHGAVMEITLYEADDRFVGHRAHRGDIVDRFDAQGGGAAVNCRERKAHHHCRSVHRAALHRLAGHYQGVGQRLDV
jgi:hypothetical protein